ncbi:MAG: DUF4298 domain-containing protein [Erysipelotrichaceae bacterium]|nr:DUF4298 domain-containing protein [Erysipelotrichaceae bacterium]
MSKQTERIEKMEVLLDEARKITDDLDKALEAYEKVQKKLDRLEKYYTGPNWMKDYEAYEKGMLPKDIKCGVLSEDAVYDLLTDREDLLDRMRKLADND